MVANLQALLVVTRALLKEAEEEEKEVKPMARDALRALSLRPKPHLALTLQALWRSRLKPKDPLNPHASDLLLWIALAEGLKITHQGGARTASMGRAPVLQDRNARMARI